MNIGILIALIFPVLAIGMGLALVLQRADVLAPLRPAPVIRGQLITVQTRDDQTIHGLCIGDHPDRLRLVDASYVVNRDRQEPIEGESVIFRENVAWVQNHGGAVALGGVPRIRARAE